MLQSTIAEIQKESATKSEVIKQLQSSATDQTAQNTQLSTEIADWRKQTEEYKKQLDQCNTNLQESKKIADQALTDLQKKTKEHEIQLESWQSLASTSTSDTEKKLRVTDVDVNGSGTFGQSRVVSLQLPFLPECRWVVSCTGTSSAQDGCRKRAHGPSRFDPGQWVTGHRSHPPVDAAAP